MGGGKGGGGNAESTIRFAPYIEDAHKRLLATAWPYNDSLITQSPYASITLRDPDLGLLGVGKAVEDFSSLFNLFRTYVETVDTQALYNSILQDSVQNPTLDAVVAAESARLDTDILLDDLPKLDTGLRDINAVMSSGFILARTLLQTQKGRTMAKFSADLKKHAFDQALSRWSTSLSWNDKAIDTYMRVQQLYWASRFDYVNAQGELRSRDTLWSFTVLDQMRSIVGTLNGAASGNVPKGDSKAAKAIGGMLGGAAAGAEIGSVVPGLGTTAGAIIGGVLGLAGGLSS